MAAKTRDVAAAALTFGMLSDPTRLGILTQLAAGPKNVTALCEALDLKQSAASHHLGLLRMSGLVSSERAGKSITYTINVSGSLIKAAGFLGQLAKG